MKFCREKGNQVDAVMVHKIDRLARNLVDHATIKALLKQKGIRLISVVENCEDSITGQLVENIMASIAEFYSANLGEEVKKGCLAKIKKGGWPHVAPLGYKNVKDDNGKPYIVPDEEMSPLIKQLFELYSLGNYSLGQLSEEMYERGLKTKSNKPQSKEMIKKILNNCFYAGRMYWQGKIYQGNHEPLISEKHFYRVQEILQSRNVDTGEKGKYQFLLRGLTYCQTCDKKLTAEIHKRGSYYRCMPAFSKVKCKESYSSVKNLDEQLEIIYQKIQPPKEVLEMIKEELEDIVCKRQKTAEKELSCLEQSLIKIEAKELKLADELIEQAISREIHSKIQQKLIAEKNRVQERQAQLKVDYREPLDFLDKCIVISSSLYHLHRKFDFPQKKKLLKAVFERIEVRNREIVNTKLNPPFSFLIGGDLERLFEDRPLKRTKQDVFEQLVNFTLSPEYGEIKMLVDQLVINVQSPKILKAA